MILIKVNPDPLLQDESSSDEEIVEGSDDSQVEKSLSHTETEKSQESPKLCGKEQQARDVQDMIANIMGLLVLKRQ